VTTTGELLLRYDQDRARSKQVELGISEIGGCRRRAGYRLHQVPPSNVGGSVQAAMGSAIHEAVASKMAVVAEPGDLIEYRVQFAGLPGTLDRYEAATCTVVDTKTTSSRWLEHIKLHGADEQHKWQGNTYGAALVKAGREVRRIRIEYIARDTGEEWTWEEPFNPEYVRAALAWLKNVREAPLEALPRDYMPDSAFCHSCRFADICWHYGLESRAAGRVLFEDRPDAVAWTEELWQARALRKDAKAEEYRCRKALETIRPAEGIGKVQVGRHVLDFRVNGIYFVSGAVPQPGVGYEEGGDDAA
jgi:CRISPR/Cas system-associated exonuclease Cas4 (RecB family)